MPRGHLARWLNIRTDTRKEDIRRVLVDPKIGCRVPKDGLGVMHLCLRRPQRCGAGSSRFLAPLISYGTIL